MAHSPEILPSNLVWLPLAVNTADGNDDDATHGYIWTRGTKTTEVMDDGSEEAILWRKGSHQRLA
ncbi:hypothetical protein HPP92_026637 [Vanilla planifolia]|uniref:Uncharacterized protein n=1 Tax=Vanilla planifolia TaxID=51239 RepID=A0A835PER1_VANPL|nr:hypothetical protein HPP92_026637 [Vanilla planifolia]